VCPIIFKVNTNGLCVTSLIVPGKLNLNIIGQTGTAILLTIIITILMSKKVNFKDAGRLFGVTFKELWLPVLTICFILAI
ncbi:L-lactate permease, partial [Staphylococcus aureus]|nr:L-lactate permease [Staphylococcus aureus]